MRVASAVMVRRAKVLLALAALGVAALSAWLAGVEVPFLPDRDAGAPRQGPPSLAEAPSNLESEARDEAGRLRSFPGLRLERRGTGTVVGRVALLVPGAGEKPLPGAQVEILGYDAGREVRASATTDAGGAFALAPLHALAGYVLRVRHPPHRDLLVRGLAVTDGRATDVGTLVFGAPTALAGTVVDSAGRPVAQACVAVERDRSAGGSLDLLRALRDLAGGPGPMAQGTSQADGSFLVTGLPPGRYLLRVTHPGHAAAFVGGVYVTADGDSSGVRVVLDPGAGFGGRVLDDRGAGVEGATVVAVAVKAEKSDTFDRQETRSGAEGRYLLDTLTSGATYFLEAHRQGFAPQGRILSAHGLTPLDLTLTPGGRLEGRVTDGRTGAPVARAEVLALTGLVGTGTAPTSALSDDAGRYAIENVLPGPLVLLEVRAPGYGPAGQGYDAKAPRNVVAGQTLVVDVALRSGGAVSGTVRGSDGRPLPYVSVAATRPGDRWSGEVASLTDEQGAYRVAGLRWGRYVMAVTAPGWAPPTDDEAVTVDLREDAPEATRDFVLSAGATVEGTVTTPEKAPATGVRVALLARDARRYGTRVRDLVAVTDASGVYRVLGAPPGLDLLVEATAASGVRTASDPFQVGPGGTRTVDLVLRPGARIVGRAVDAAGRPVAAARVRYGHVEPEDLARLRDSFRADEFLAPRTFHADDGGSFACDGAPPGAVILKVEADGFAPWFRKDLAVPQDGDLVGITAALEGSKSIRGRVTASDTGRPIAGAWVYAKVRDAEGAPADDGRVKTLVSAETAADGAYALDRLPPGPVDVVVWLALGYRNAWEDPANGRRDGVTAGSSGVDFRLAPSAPAPAPGR